MKRRKLEEELTQKDHEIEDLHQQIQTSNLDSERIKQEIKDLKEKEDLLRKQMEEERTQRKKVMDQADELTTAKQQLETRCVVW